MVAGPGRGLAAVMLDAPVECRAFRAGRQWWPFTGCKRLLPGSGRLPLMTR